MKLLCNHTTWICSQSAVGVKKQSKVHKTAPAPVSKSMNYVTISRTSNCKFQHIRGDQMCNLHNIISPRVPIIYESCILSSWGDTHKSPPPSASTLYTSSLPTCVFDIHPHPYKSAISGGITQTPTAPVTAVPTITPCLAFCHILNLLNFFAFFLKTLAI